MVEQAAFPPKDTELFVDVVPGKNWDWVEYLHQLKITPFPNLLCTQLFKSLLNRLIFHRFIPLPAINGMRLTPNFTKCFSEYCWATL